MNSGTVYGTLESHKLTFSDNVKLRVGNNKISLLSIAVGLPVSSLTFVVIPIFATFFNFQNDFTFFNLVYV